MAGAVEGVNLCSNIIHQAFQLLAQPYLLKAADHVASIVLNASVGDHFQATVHDWPVEQIKTH